MKAASRLIAAAVSLTIALSIAGLSRLSYDATIRSLPALARVIATTNPTDSGLVAAADHEAVGALIRLSWRTASERIEHCRRLSVEEIAELPVHMRREEVCEGRLVPYRLRVALDDSMVIDEVVQPAGARGDRPLFVLRDLAVPAGEYVVTVDWSRVDDEDRRGDDERGDQDGSGDRDGGDDDDRERGDDRNHADSDDDEAQAWQRTDDDNRAGGVSSDERRAATGAAEAARSERTGEDPRSRSREGRTPGNLEIRAVLRLEPRDISLITYDTDERALVARGRGIVADGQ